MDNPALSQAHLAFPPFNSQPVHHDHQPRSASRKYTEEQIRFVLSKWQEYPDQDDLATQFMAKFQVNVSKKHVKYIKDTYSKHSGWIKEFGHLITERQRKGHGRKTNTPDTTSKENVPIGGTFLPSGFPQPSLSNAIGGGTPFQSNDTINTNGLGNTNHGWSYSVPNNYPASQPNGATSRGPSVSQSPTISGAATGLNAYLSGNTTVANQMASPSVMPGALPTSQTPMLAGGSGTSANFTPSPRIPPQTSPVPAPQSGNARHQLPAQAVGITPVQQSLPAAFPPLHPSPGWTQQSMAAALSSNALRGAGTAEIQKTMPTRSPPAQNIGTPVVQKTTFFNSPTQGAQAQRFTPTGSPPGQRSVGTTPTLQSVANFSSSPVNQTSMLLVNNPAQPRPQQITPPRTSTAVPTAGMLFGFPPSLVNGSRPPTHIQLPKQDFDASGVWYNDSHDGCQIQGRHRHSNDGSVFRPGPQSGASPPVVSPAGKQADTINTTEPVRQKTASPGSGTLVDKQGDTYNVAAPANQNNQISPEKRRIAGPQNRAAGTGVSPKQPSVASLGEYQPPHNAGMPIPQQAQPTQQMNAVRQIQQNQQSRVDQQAQQLQRLQQTQVPWPAQQVQNPQLAQNAQGVQSVEHAKQMQQQLLAQDVMQKDNVNLSYQQVYTLLTANEIQTKDQLIAYLSSPRVQQARAVLKAQQQESPKQPQGVRQVQQLQPGQQVQAVKPAQQLQSPQQPQALQQGQKLQSPRQPQVTQSVQQLQSGQQVPAVQPVQQLQSDHQVQGAQLAQAAKPAQQARVSQQIRGPQQPQQAQQPLSRPAVRHLGQGATPHQQAGATGIVGARRGNEGLKSPPKSSPTTPAIIRSGPSPHAHHQLFPAKLWFEDDYFDPAPDAFSPPPFLPDGSRNYAFYDRLPDIIDGNHCQHEIYEKFPESIWTINPLHPVPVLATPSLARANDDRRSTSGYNASTHSSISSNPRKRQATADETVSTGTQNGADAGDSERATKKRNVGGGLSVSTATSGNTRN